MSLGISSALSCLGGQASLNDVFLLLPLPVHLAQCVMEVCDASWKGCGDFSETLNGQQEVGRGLGRFISTADGTDAAEQCSGLEGFCPGSYVGIL